jgi:integrase
MKNEKFPLEVKAGGVRVKIYRVVEPGRERFTLAYHDGSVRKLKQFSDFASARREAKTVAETLNAGRGAALELSGADRDAYLAAVRQLKPLDVPLNVAVAEYVKARQFNVPVVEAAKFYAESHNAKLPDKTVAEVVEELFIAKKADGVSEAYLAYLKSYLGHFSRDFRVRIADVQTAHIDAWLRGLKLSPRSRNNHRNAVALLFNFAKSAGYLNRDRTTAAEHTALARKKVEAIEVFTPAELTSLLAAADAVALPFLALGAFCGLRSAEILRLKWEDLNWPEKVIEIRAGVSKTRTRRLPPLTAPALSWLEAYKGKTGPVVPAKLHRDAVEAACAASGVAWKRNGLRHGFGTYRMAILKDPVRVAYEMGNSPQVIRQCYDRVVTEAVGAKWFSILPKKAANVLPMVKGVA